MARWFVRLASDWKPLEFSQYKLAPTVAHVL